MTDPKLVEAVAQAIARADPERKCSFWSSLTQERYRDMARAALTASASDGAKDREIERLRRLLQQAKHHVVFHLDVDANAGDLANEIDEALASQTDAPDGAKDREIERLRALLAEAGGALRFAKLSTGQWGADSSLLALIDAALAPQTDAPGGKGLDMCKHGADRGSYCGYCGGYSHPGEGVRDAD